MPQQPEIQDIYPLSFMQEGMLFHSLYDEQSRAYFEQASFTINGQLDLERFQKSMDAVFDRYDIFRTAFIYKNVAKPRQVVLKQRHCHVHVEDISHLNEKDKEHCTEAFKEQDKSKGFDLQTDVLMRISILKWAPDHYVCIWSHHHILMDGWCLGIVIKDFLHIYQALGKGQFPDLPPVQPYGTYIKWLMQQEREEAAEYWKKGFSISKKLRLCLKEQIKCRMGHYSRSRLPFLKKKPPNYRKSLQHVVRHLTLFSKLYGESCSKSSIVATMLYSDQLYQADLLS